MPRILFALFTLILGTLTLEAAKPEGWTQWRGPTRDGHAAGQGLNSDWKESQPGLLWKLEGLGDGFSSVAVADGKIYTLGNDKSGQAVVAIDEASQKILWKQNITDKVPDHSYAGSRCTPTVDGDRLYVVSSAGSISCLEAADGKIVWQKDFAKEWNGKMMSGWGFSESPLVDGDWVLCTPGGKDAMVVALDKQTGKEVWRAKANSGERGNNGAGYASIGFSHAAGVKQYVQLTGKGVMGIRAADGKVLWEYNNVANGVANIPDPICIDDYVFCSSGYGTGAALLKITGAKDKLQAEEQYFLDAKTFQNHHGNMVRIGDHIYAGHGHNNGFPICLNWKTGEVVWGGDIRAPGTGSAAVAYADGHLVFRYQNGIVALIEATPEEYRLKGSFKPEYVKGPSWAHSAITDGKLYLREQDVLMCYDLSGGK